MKRLFENKEDFVGYKKDKIEVIGVGYFDEKSRKQMYEVKCHNCGAIYYQSLGNLLQVQGKGCKNCKGLYGKDHAVKYERLHNVWTQMKHRCNCTESDYNHFKHYGGRGIKVCKEWNNSYEAFKEWAYANGWNEDNMYASGRNKLTIDRIDNNGDYCPENCRIITHREQQYNKRTTVYIEFEGKRYNYEELSILLGIPKTTLISRVKRGWTDEELLGVYHYKNCEKVEYDGKEYTFVELSKLCGLPRKLIYQRIRKCGWTVEQAIGTPVGEFNPHIKLYEYKGEMLSIAEIARRCGLNRTTLQYRLDNGWNLEKATTINLMHKGEKQ